MSRLAGLTTVKSLCLQGYNGSSGPAGAGDTESLEHLSWEMTDLGAADRQMQERVLAFLGEPEHHPGVRRIDTHGVSVFLDSKRALKIKRAVRFPFLDYSAREKRKTACDPELEVNRQFPSQIYRGGVAITEELDGSLNIRRGLIGRRSQCLQELTVRAEEGMRAVKRTDRHVMRNQRTEPLARKPGVEVEGGRLDLERRLA
jgi:hypothetical protein